MKNTTLGIITHENSILLCMKKRGFGAGLWNGTGGKVEADETLEQAMKRELYEETCLEIKEEDMKKVGVLHFFFEENNSWDQDVHVFQILRYSGIPKETEEMKPQWFDLAQIPYDEMWEDDKIWLPRMLQGEKIEYNFWFGKDGKMKRQEKIL